MQSQCATTGRHRLEQTVPHVRFGRAGLLLALIAAAGCGQIARIHPEVPASQGHIAAPPTPNPSADAAIPAPARTTAFVPPPKPAIKPQTYSVVVNEVPVKELLLALARDTKQNIDIHPGLSGLVSLNAIDETLPAILERISKQVNLRYKTEGNTIIVSPDTAYLKTYRIAYVNMVRDTTSSIGVSGEIAAGGSTGGAGGASGGGAGGGATGGTTSGSITRVVTTSRNDFWEQLRDNLRAILASTRRQSLTAEERAERAENVRAAREERLQQAEAVARAGAGATTLFTTAFGSSGSSSATTLVDQRDEIMVNPAGGTVSVLATEKQHQLIQQHLDSITNAVQRQVLIEATIVEVALNDAYQGGVDWSRIASRGFGFSQALAGGVNAAAVAAGATAGNMVALTYNSTSSSGATFSGNIQFLQEFGSTRVLSSPKLMALNNQTALLKVVDNVVYFEVQAQTTTSTTGPSLTTFNTTPKMVSVGVVMGVTPQIADDGRVSLTVRPTISRVLRFKTDPNPALVTVPNLVPEIQVREMESVLQVGSGQTVMLGGLMQDEAGYKREQVPVLGDLPVGGDLFRFRNEAAKKSELVIFLRPTVVANPSLDSEELKFFQRFLPQPNQPISADPRIRSGNGAP